MSVDKNDSKPKAKVTTSITKIEPDKITIKGYNQNDLIDKLSYPEMVYLLLKGELANEKDLKIFNHILVSFADHGLTPPSTQTARLIGTSGSPLNVCLSGAFLSFGKYHAGAIEGAMDLFQNSIKSMDSVDDEAINKMAIDIVNHFKNNKKNIPGFGHRYHKEDPRASKILSLAIEEGFVSNHTKLAIAIEEQLQEKNVKMNIDGINGAILSDMGFSSEAGFGIFMIGRIPGLIAHVIEQSNNGEIFKKLFDFDEISYIGEENKEL
ncbi:MAG: citryl-CoA lyase [Methanobrevibacter sp.]|jgi:citrate synthase|nr:citryl-CoA lyase [Methanobrevibacter sp.]